jgi:hypothetical protein
MNPQNKDFPKTPPFVFNDAPVEGTNEPASQPVTHPKTPTQNNGYPSNRGMLNVAILLISSLSMGIALIGGAWIGYGVLHNGIGDQPGLFARIIVAGLAYGVGWSVGLFGIRMLGNLILPLAMKAYAWIILGGLAILQIAIISKLFKQLYTPEKFVYYVILFGAGLVALVGLHLILEDHSLVPFSFPILIISLSHLYLIVFHYIFVPSEKVKYEFLWGDAIFFLITAIVGVLMLAHLGILSVFRKSIAQTFSENTDRLVPPS